MVGVTSTDRHDMQPHHSVRASIDEARTSARPMTIARAGGENTRPPRSARVLRAGLATIAVAAAGALSACGAQSASTAAGQSAVSVKVDGQVRLTLTHEANLATARCMHRLGFEYFVPQIADEPQADISFPYGNDDVAFARRYPFTAHRRIGGGVVDLAKPVASPERSPGLSRGGTPAWKHALYGNGETVTFPLPGGGQGGMFVGGCSAEGVRAVFGSDVKRWLIASNIVDSLDAEVAGRVLQEPQYRAAYAKWRGCVQRAGYTPTSPQSRALTTDPEDRRANVTNAACGARAGVQATGEKLEMRVRPTVDRENEAAIVDYNAIVADAQARTAARR